LCSAPRYVWRHLVFSCYFSAGILLIEFRRVYTWLNPLLSAFSPYLIPSLTLKTQPHTLNPCLLGFKTHYCKNSLDLSCANICSYIWYSISSNMCLYQERQDEDWIAYALFWRKIMFCVSKGNRATRFFASYYFFNPTASTLPILPAPASCELFY
jgi:hypothetical protein